MHIGPNAAWVVRKLRYSNNKVSTMRGSLYYATSLVASPWSSNHMRLHFWVMGKLW
jgi:hypothetical protein